MERRVRAVAVAVIAALACLPAPAAERLSRRIDGLGGAPVSSVDDFDQDARGFLWLSTPQGLVRFDGMEMRVVDPHVHAIAPGCARTGSLRAIRVLGDSRELVELVGNTFVTIPTPAGTGNGELLTAACSDDGVLWSVIVGELWRRSETAGWTKIEKAPNGREWDAIWPGPRGSVLAGSAGSVYRVSREGSIEIVAELHKVMSCFLREDGALVALDWRRDGGYLVLVRNGSLEHLAFRPGRPIAVTERGGTIWASFDSLLVGVRSDRTEMEIGASPSAMVGGGPLLVDREDVLWVATPRGLVQFPEPDTAGIEPDIGGGRWLHRFGADLFMSTWSGTQRIVEIEGRWKPIAYASSVGAICRDARERTWTVTFDDLGRTDPDGRLTKIPFEHVGSLGPCTLDPAGTLWMPTLRGLLRLERDSDRPAIEPLPAGDEREGGAVASVLLDRNGRLWVGGFGRICHGESTSDGVREWTCEPIHTGVFVTDLLETDGGKIWAASEGVFERGDDGDWTRLSLRSTEVAVPSVTGLASSPRGGTWLVGRGAILRVAGSSVEGRMTILERLGGWHGIPSATTNDLMEMEDGTVWLVVESSLIRVPGSVRATPPPPPRVAVTGLAVDGEARPIDLQFRSPYRRNRLDVQVSAFSYREPSLLRYRFRMTDEDPWSQPSRNPVFQLYNVSAGRYALRFAASLDGEHWTETDAPVKFQVDLPWFRQAWFLALVVFGATVVAWGVHRTRVARLIALERQRTHIAMDLHDAIGSGLGSIGLLAGLGSRPATDSEKRRKISDQIATMASELGVSLSEIVWSLRPGSEPLEALAQHLKERGNKLFVEHDVRFRTEFPVHWPNASLSLPLRRNLLLIAIEALHNASKHAEASEVCLGSAPAGSLWSLWVEDDGVGIGRGVHPGTGMGIENMKRRAEEIGAKVEWAPGSLHGTRVTVVFDPR